MTRLTGALAQGALFHQPVMFCLLVFSAIAGAQEPKIFMGNLHSHTAKSDGSGTPEQACIQVCTRHGKDRFSVAQRTQPPSSTLDVI